MFNPPSQVRTALYVLTVFINAVLLVVMARDVQLPVLVEAGVAGLNAIIALMAKVNVSPDQE